MNQNTAPKQDLSCSDCKHMVFECYCENPGGLKVVVDHCTKSVRMETQVLCDLARQSDRMCGPEGKYFEEKE